MEQPQCTICQDPRRNEIEQALRCAPLRRVASRFGFSKSALHNHRNQHMTAQLTATAELERRRLALAAPQLRRRLEEVHADADALYRRISGEDNMAAIRALAVMTRQIEVAFRLAAALPADSTTGASGVEALSAAVLRALEPHPEIRRQVAESIHAIEQGLAAGEHP